MRMFLVLGSSSENDAIKDTCIYYLEIIVWFLHFVTMINDSPVRVTSTKQIKVEDVDPERQKRLFNYKGIISFFCSQDSPI